MKKIIGIISAVIIGATSMHAMAADEIGVVLDGKKLTFDQNPVIKNDRTLVPFRGILEAMGAQVSWDGEVKKVTAKKDDITIELVIDNNTMYKNGESIELDVAPTVINDRTMVPARAVSESFEAKVSWDGQTKTVIISTDTVIQAAIEKLNSSKSIYMVQDMRYKLDGVEEQTITTVGVDNENKIVYNSIIVSVGGEKVHENTFIANPQKGYSIQNDNKKEYVYESNEWDDIVFFDDTNYYEFIEENDSDIIYRMNGGSEILYIDKVTNNVYKTVIPKEDLTKLSSGEVYEVDSVTEIITDSSFIKDKWDVINK